MTLGTAPQAKASSIIRGERLHQWQPWIERCAGLLLLTASFLGSIVAFNGGWDVTFHGSLSYKDWEFTPFAVAVGVLLQLVCTMIEWVYAGRRRSLPYLTALLVDAGSSLFGFLQVLYPPLLTFLVLFAPMWLAVTLAGLSSLTVVVLLAILPEYILVE